MPLPFLIPIFGAIASAAGAAGTAIATGAAAAGAAATAAGAAAVGAGAAGLAAVGTAAAGVASAVGAGALGAAALGTLGAVGTGALVLGAGGVALSSYVISKNEEERKRAQSRARREASREKEREIQRKAAEYAKKLEDLKAAHEVLNESTRDELRLEGSRLYGDTQGLILGLRDKGQEPEQITLDLNKELKKMREQCGIKEVA
ncbi:MAG: hypothetical protein IJS40_02800 [Synergistaceae bacterium]|nr:hypothetical protein [Synergistaceae bacterium]